MLREAPSGGGRAQTFGQCRVPGRVWHRPDVKTIPDEPGWSVTVAAVSIAREEDDLYRWHDGIETSCNVARRALWRFAHGRKLPDGSKSGRLACAFGEIVHAFARAGLFPTAGQPPRYDPAGEEWQAYLKRTRTQARRVCDRLHTAGIATVSPELDNLGRDWRVVIDLLAVDVDAARVAEAQRRHRDWGRRRDRSETRGVRRDLRVIARSATALTKAQRARLHKEFQQRSRGRAELEGDLCNQREASRPLAAKPSADSEQTSTSPYTSHRRGAHARGVPSLRSRFGDLRQRPGHPNASGPSTQAADNVTEGEGRSTGAVVGAGGHLELPRGGRDGNLQATGGMRGSVSPLIALTAQIAAMAPSADQLTPAVATAIVRGWWQARRGLTAAALPVVDDTAAAIDALGPLRLRAAAIERLAEHRPAGWPKSGAAALLTLALIHDLSPASLELAGAADELIELMRGDQRSGGRAVAKLGGTGPASVPAGYEGVGTLRRRLTDQLAAAGDSIDAYPSLRAAEEAALEHERTGRLQAGPDPDWDAPWNRDKPQPTLWPSPTVQRSWRRRLLPPLPQVLAEPKAVDRLAEPATYAAAIANVEHAQPGARLTAALLEDLVQAFHARRYGVAGAIARRDWRPRARREQIAAVVDAYEAFPESVRPVGWPACGVAALLHLATWRDPGSHTLDGKPVQMRRPEHLPMAIGRLRVLIEDMRRHTERGPRIDEAKRRRRGRGGRSAQPQTQAAPAKFAFRTLPAAAGAGWLPPAESPPQTYERIRRQLLACGEHPADHPSLEEAELALVDLEHEGRLPAGNGPSPTAMREARHQLQRSTGPIGVAESEWEHLSAAAADHLAASDVARLAEISPVAVHDGNLILTGSPEALDWAKRIRLTQLVEQLARQLDLAHSVALVAEAHASVFRPSTELRGPADARAARGDRYLLERATRYAVGGNS